MPRLHVCSLPRVEEVTRASGARSLLTLLSPTGVVVERPDAIAPERHLVVGLSDIVEARDGHTLAAEHHAAQIIAFFRTWDRVDPLLIHCYAGVSRSTAAAFIGVCALAPHRKEAEVASQLRRASPTATPNTRLVALADDALGRGGRMVDAVRGIGRGADCFEGLPFTLEIETS